MKSIGHFPALLLAAMILILPTGLLAGCVHEGELIGAWPSSNGPGPPVLFHFRSDRGDGTGKIWTTLPTGESFSGAYVQIKSTTKEQAIAPLFQGWSPFWSDWRAFGGAWIDGSTFAAFRTNYSDRVAATLAGDRGERMRCRFHLDNPAAGLRGGGTGECQTSKDEKIRVRF